MAFIKKNVLSNSPVVYNEGLEAGGGLSLDPVLEDEAQDTAGHLHQ